MRLRSLARLRVIWHSEDVRIDHGSLLLFLKPEGWSPSESASGMVKAGVQAVYSKLIYDKMRENFGIQNTPVQLNIPEFDAKYRIEVSDFGAAQAALTSGVRDFLVKQRPPATPIQLGDNALDIIVEDATYLRKFEKVVALVDYGVRLAQAVAASQNAASSVEKPDGADTPTL